MGKSDDKVRCVKVIFTEENYNVLERLVQDPQAYERIFNATEEILNRRLKIAKATRLISFILCTFSPFYLNTRRLIEGYETFESSKPINKNDRRFIFGTSAIWFAFTSLLTNYNVVIKRWYLPHIYVPEDLWR